MSDINKKRRISFRKILAYVASIILGTYLITMSYIDYPDLLSRFTGWALRSASNDYVLKRSNGLNDNTPLGNENAGNENAGNENAGNENAGNENAGNENAGNENAGIISGKVPDTEEEVYPQINLQGFANVTRNFYFNMVEKNETLKDVLGRKKQDIQFEKVIPLNKQLENIDITIWEKSMLYKLVPINDMIEEYSNYYSIDPLFIAKLFLLESSYDPLSIGNENEIGLGQILPANEVSRRSSVSSLSSPLYCLDFVSTKSSWDVRNNIILCTAAVKDKLDYPPIKDYDDLYAYYSLGNNGLDQEGNISPKAREYVKNLNERYSYLVNIVPLLDLSENEILSIKDKETREILFINIATPDGEETYKKIQSMVLRYLAEEKKPGFDNALHFELLLMVTRVLDHLYEVPGQEKIFNDAMDGMARMRDLIPANIKDKEMKDVRAYYWTLKQKYSRVIKI